MALSARAKLLGLLSIGIGMFLLGCGGGGGSSTKPAISVSLTPATAQTIDQGQTIKFTAMVTNDTGGGVSWSQTGQGALSGQTTTTATYTAPSSGAPGTGSVTATSVVDPTKNAAVNITVTAPPTITSTSPLPPATAGTAYSHSVTAIGGAGTSTFSISSGTLPTGLRLNSSTGAITGTPNVAGTANFTVQVADSSTAGPVTGSQPLSLTVAAVPVITTTSLSAAMIGTPYSQTIAVTGGAPALTFSIPGGALPTGLALNSATGTIAGTATGATGTTSFTVKVSDSNAVTANQALSLTVNPPTALTITTTSLLNPLLGESYNQTLQYTANSATLPVTWSIQSGSLPAGLSLNASTGAITGTPTTAGTSTFTVELADSTTPTPATATQMLTATVTSASVCGTGSEALLNGQYAVSLAGFDGSGPVGMLASFTADGTGKITAGVEDINSTGPSGVQTNLSVTTASSSYMVGSDNRGCLTLVAGGVTRNFRLTFGNINAGVAGGGRILEFDTTGTNTVGTITIQDPSTFSNTAVTGNYNFAMNSPLSAAAGGGNYAIVGVLNLSGTTVTGVGDINFNGSVDSGNVQYPASPITFTAGTYNIGANGRGTLSFTPPGTSTINEVIYVLNTSQILMMSSDAQSATSALSLGFAGLQAGAPYANSSLNATSVLFMSGQTTSGAGSSSRVEAGIFNPDSVMNFTFSGDLNSGGTIAMPSIAGTYSVATNGRVLIMNTGSTTPALIIYLVSPNEGLVMSTDPYVMVGDLEPQTGGPFTNSTPSGTYAIATINPVVPASALIEGAETYDPAGDVAATFEFNDNGSLSLGNLFTGTYTVSSNGRVVRTWNGSTQKLSYIISPTRLVTFGNTPSDTNPTLFISQQ